MSSHRTTLARLAWAVLTVLSLSLYVMRIPHRAALVAPPSAYFVAWELPLVIFWVLVSAIILWRTETSRWTFFVAAMLTTYGPSYMQDGRTLELLPPVLSVVAGVLHQFGGWAMFAFCFLFPDGKPVPKHFFWVLVPAWAVIAAPAFYFPDSPYSLYQWPPLVSTSIVNGLLVVGIASQVYRFRTTTSKVVQQQSKWVAFGIVMVAAGNMVGLTARMYLWGEPALLFTFDAISHVAHATVPLTILVAIMRYRLWEIDRIINRALVYLALTGAIALIYTLVAGWAGFLFGEQSQLGPLIGTGLIAFLFMPLRDWLRAAINRLMYGERDNPTAVLARLGTQLEANLAPEQVPPTVVKTVVESLRVPYAALLLAGDETYRLAAEAGSPVPEWERVPFPLLDQGEQVGLLVVGLREGEEGFHSADMHLLQGLARQAGQAVHTIRLNQALQRSREQLVTAREEERRRLRNDLHDGLGPALSGYAMTVAAARRQVDSQPEASKEMLLQLEHNLQGSVQEVRRLIYNLRPPLLDDLGLVGALRRSAGEFQRAGLAVQVVAPENMEPLPAAAEVAAYRISQEALNNVVKHAHATQVTISLTVVEQAGPGSGRRLSMTVVDNGRGIDPNRTAGVGLSSMRERAAELGGACTVTRDEQGGTRVTAWVPLAAEEE